MKFRNKYLFAPLLFIIVIFVTVSLFTGGCKSKNGSTYTLTGDTILDGKNLVEINCTKCHALVPVNALTKDVWKHHTLPSMAPYFGLTAYLGGYFKG